MSVPALLAAGDVAAHAGDWSRATEHYRQAYALAPGRAPGGVAATIGSRGDRGVLKRGARRG